MINHGFCRPEKTASQEGRLQDTNEGNPSGWPLRPLAGQHVNTSVETRQPSGVKTEWLVDG